MENAKKRLEAASRDYALDSLLGEAMAACSPHQRAVLGLLAVSHCYGLPLAPMLGRLASETSRGFSRQAMFLAAMAHAGEDPVDAIEDTVLVLTPTCVKALQSARDEGRLDSFYRSVLERSPDFSADLDFGHEDDARFSHLVKRGLFVFFTLIFILLKIVPEFRKIYDEFGLELPLMMQAILGSSNLVAKWWFLSLLILIPIGFWMFRRQLRRWNPVTWRQPIVSKAARQRRILAIESRDNQKKKEQEPQWNQLATQGVISKREARVLESTESGETRAWLLRWKANSMGESSRFRSSLYFNLVIWLGNIALALVVFAFCVAILTSLIQIIEGMS